MRTFHYVVGLLCLFIVSCVTAQPTRPPIEVKPGDSSISMVTNNVGGNRVVSITSTGGGGGPTNGQTAAQVTNAVKQVLVNSNFVNSVNVNQGTNVGGVATIGSLASVTNLQLYGSFGTNYGSASYFPNAMTMAFSGGNTIVGQTLFTAGGGSNFRMSAPNTNTQATTYFTGLGGGGGFMALDANGLATRSDNGSSMTNLNASNLASGTVPAARVPAGTGDVTNSAGSTAFTLANSGVTAGVYTSADIQVDAKGRVIAATNGTGGASSGTSGTNTGGGTYAIFSGKVDTNISFNTISSGTGIGISSNNNVLTISATNTANWLTNMFLPVTSTGTSETNLMSYTVPAGQLANAGDTLIIYASGSFAANADLKDLKMKFGATTIFDSGSAVLNGADWSVVATITLSNATTQIATVQFASGSATLIGSSSVTLPGETASGTIVLKFTGTSAGNADIIQKTMNVSPGPRGVIGPQGNAGPAAGTNITFYSSLAYDFQSLALASTTVLNFTNNAQTLLVTNTVAFISTNRIAGRTLTIQLLALTTNQSMTWPAWHWLGQAAPSIIQSNKYALLNLTCIGGTAETNILATYAEEP